MCLEHCFNSLPVKHGHNEEWREGLCGENPGDLKVKIKQLRQGYIDLINGPWLSQHESRLFAHRILRGIEVKTIEEE